MATMARALNPVRSTSKAQEVFLSLRSAILAGDLKPGDPLKEAHLAQQLHVSQVPIREALLQLEHLGLVVRVPDKGTTVTKLTRAEMLDLLAVRTHLEDLAFRLAAANLDKPALKKLREALTTLEKKISQNDYYGSAEADLRFHETVWNLSGNRVLMEELGRLCTSWLAFVSLHRHMTKESLRQSAGNHRALIDVLEDGDSAAISRAIREHLSPERSIPSSLNE
jgi:DNA-binding GntR family transcriptional regulator